MDKDSELVKEFMDALNARERRLVEILSGGEFNRTRAMIRAGYSKTTAYKQQYRVCNKVRVKRALLAIEYIRGSKYLSNDELTMIGLNPRSVRQKERRQLERESRVEARNIAVRRMLGL